MGDENWARGRNWVYGRNFARERVFIALGGGCGDRVCFNSIPLSVAERGSDLEYDRKSTMWVSRKQYPVFSGIDEDYSKGKVLVGDWLDQVWKGWVRLS